MKYRALGKKGPRVSALGLGCMGMSDFYGSHDDDASVRVLHRALDLGVNFFDTADVYGIGKNEELVGRAFRDQRDKVFIATKFGNVRGKDGSWLGVNGRPEYVKSACEASLRRLGMSVIDLYYQHRVDPNTPIEDTVGAMAELVREGKVRYLGLSEAATGTIRRADVVHPITALQTEYSLWTRDPESEILPVCRGLDIAFVAYSPIGRGFLSGKIQSSNDLEEKDVRRSHPRFEAGNLEKNIALLEPLKEIANEKGCTPVQVALTWVLSRGEDVIPIPGTKRMNYLEENLKAIEITLSEDDLAELDKMFQPGAATGQRYPERALKAVNR